MKFIPDGWSVDVDGNNMLVTFPAGDQSGRRLLSRHEARVLRLQLHLRTCSRAATSGHLRLARMQLRVRRTHLVL